MVSKTTFLFADGQLILLHLLELVWIRRFHLERIEAQLTRLMLGLNAPKLSARHRVEAQDRVDLRNRRPESLQRCLLEGQVSRHVNVASEKGW